MALHFGIFTRPRYVPPSTKEDYRNNLPADSTSGPTLDKLYTAMDKVEAQIARGEPVTAPHPYDGCANSEEIRRAQASLRAETGMISESWKSYAPSCRSGALSVGQIPSILRGEGKDVASKIVESTAKHLEEQARRKAHLEKRGRSHLLRGAGEFAGATALSLAVAGPICFSAIGGLPGLALGTLAVACGLGVPVCTGLDFGKINFEEAADYRKSSKENTPPSENHSIQKLQKREQDLSNMAEQAEGWSRILEEKSCWSNNASTRSKPLRWLFSGK